jgi:hypothetical protein
LLTTSRRKNLIMLRNIQSSLGIALDCKQNILRTKKNADLERAGECKSRGLLEEVVTSQNSKILVVTLSLRRGGASVSR